MGEAGDVPNVGKVLTKNPPFRRKILLFPGKNPQHRHAAGTDLSHLIGGIPYGIGVRIHSRALDSSPAYDPVVGSPVAEHDQDLSILRPPQKSFGSRPDGQAVPVIGGGKQVKNPGIRLRPVLIVSETVVSQKLQKLKIR